MSALDKRILFPDYMNCSLQLTGSIAKAFGQAAPFGSLAQLDAMLTPQVRNIILLVLDGMGVSTLQEHLMEDSFLRRHWLHTLSAVFPSTTLAATASLRTGLPPSQHGRLGWTMFFPQAQHSVDVYPNTLQFTRCQAADHHIADRFLPLNELSQRIARSTQAQSVAISKHDRVHAATLSEIRLRIQEQLALPGRHYLYVYDGQPDASMHDFGVNSPETHDIMAGIDLWCETLHQQLPKDTLLIITADHGLLDTEPVYMADHDELAGMLVRPAFIEPRAASFQVKPECINQFPDAFHRAFPGQFLLLTKQEALGKELFGPEPYMPGLEQYLGDFVALAIAGTALYHSRGQDVLIGMHAGLTSSEMEVPLILCEK